MEKFKYSRRQATAVEVEAVGFTVENGQARSPKTGAWYALENFLVANSATIDGEQKFGQFLYLADDLPMAERVLIELSPSSATKINIAYDVPAEAVEKIKAHLAEVAAFDPNWNGANFEIEREDFTCIPDDDTPDAAALLRTIFDIIDNK